LGDNTFRKVLRALLGRSRTWDELTAICGDENKLRTLLRYLQAGGIADESEDCWTKGPQCDHI